MENIMKCPVQVYEYHWTLKAWGMTKSMQTNLSPVAL